MPFFNSGKKLLITHDGRFHADDVFACATLMMMLGDKAKIIRTRNPKIIATGDYVFDVGGTYDSEKKHFDHHQRGGAGIRDNSIPYAAFGLVWKEYGEIVGGSKKISDIVDARLVQPIDAGDNAVSVFDTIPGMPFPYIIQNMFGAFVPTWKEDPRIADDMFKKLVTIAIEVIQREIVQARDYIDAEEKVGVLYDKCDDKRILILDNCYPWEEIALKYPEPLFVVSTRSEGKWKAEGALVSKGSFDRRAYFPKEWAGLRDEELAEVWRTLHHKIWKANVPPAEVEHL